VIPTVPYNVILLTTDSLRADCVGPRGEDPSVTPHLDELRRDSVDFSCACSASSYTWGVFASVFLSAYPATVTTRRGVLVAQRPTLAELLQRNGYMTAGFNSNPFISTGFGYGRGFDLLDDGLVLKGARIPDWIYPLLARAQRMVMRQPYLSAAAINRKAARWLRQTCKHRRPFFLWLHYMDVHGPYQSKRGLTYLNKLRAEWLWRKACATPEKISPREHEELLRFYREEIAYADHHIGLLLALLRQLGVCDSTIIILCADHGDEFREHGRYSHWRQLYDELVRVPLIIRHPEGQRGLSVDTPVGLVDILPTIVDMLSLEADSSQFVGQSLWSLLRDGDTRGLSGFVVGDATPDRDDTIVSIRTDLWKLIIDSTKGGAELYDLERDPGEQVNVIAQYPEVAQELEAKLWAEFSKQPIEATGQVAGPEWNRAEEQEVLARLQALGYVDWVEEHKQRQTRDK